MQIEFFTNDFDPDRGSGEGLQINNESLKKRVTMIALKIVGGACWILAYREAVIESKISGKALLPARAIAFNLIWESIYSLGGIVTSKRLTHEDRIQTVINVSWLLFDLTWAQSLAKTGYNIPKRAFALAAIYQLYFLFRYPVGEAARISALWQNLAFSGYCAISESCPNSTTNVRFTMLRAAGTAVPTLTSGILRGVQQKYLLPGLGCIGFDIISAAKSYRNL